MGDPVEMSYESQMEIVPPPRPHKEARLRRLAQTVPHILTHKPFNPYCDICRGAKLREGCHRKGAANEVLEEAKEFGDHTTGNFLASKGGVAANKPSLLSVLISLATNRHLYSSFSSSPLL